MTKVKRQTVDEILAEEHRQHRKVKWFRRGIIALIAIALFVEGAKFADWAFTVLAVCCEIGE